MENETFNLNVAAICRYLSRYTEEVAKSSSAGVTALSTFDQKRLTGYVESLRIYVEFVWNLQADGSGSLLDLPETHPRSQVVPMIDPVGEMENNALIDIVEYFKTLYVEMMSSQSSRLSTGLISHDYDRAIAILDTIDAYVAQFVLGVTPEDLPESSPRATMPTAGKTGVRKN